MNLMLLWIALSGAEPPPTLSADFSRPPAALGRSLSLEQWSSMCSQLNLSRVVSKTEVKCVDSAPNAYTQWWYERNAGSSGWTITSVEGRLTSDFVLPRSIYEWKLVRVAPKGISVASLADEILSYLGTFTAIADDGAADGIRRCNADVEQCHWSHLFIESDRRLIVEVFISKESPTAAPIVWLSITDTTPLASDPLPKRGISFSPPLGMFAGLHGVRFGDTPVSGMRPLEVVGDTVVYSRGENLVSNIGSFESSRYAFFRNRLWAISLTVTKGENAVKVVEGLIERFGVPDKSEADGPTFYWVTETVSIVLHGNDASSPELIFYYNPIFQQLPRSSMVNFVGSR